MLFTSLEVKKGMTSDYKAAEKKLRSKYHLDGSNRGHHLLTPCLAEMLRAINNRTYRWSHLPIHQVVDAFGGTSILCDIYVQFVWIIVMQPSSHIHRT